MEYRSCMKRNGTKRGKKKANLGKFQKWFRYRNRAVPVPPSRSQTVPVPIQALPVSSNRMQSVPVPIRAVPVLLCPKCSDCYDFSYLSLNSCTDSIGTLLND